MTDKEKIRAEIVDRINCYKGSEVNFHNRISELENILAFIDSMQEERDEIVDKYLYGKESELVDVDDLPKEEPVSEDLEEACQQLAEKARIHKAKTISPFFSQTDYIQGVKAGANWQKEQIEEALLSEVLPCFMHGGEADEVVAKLDEVLNQKK